MRTIDRICISEYGRVSDDFKASFCELIGALSTSFREMGIRVDYRVNEFDPEAPNLVFGYHRLIRDAVRKRKLSAIPKQSGSGWRRCDAPGTPKQVRQRPEDSEIEAELEAWMLPDNCIPVNLEPLNEASSWLVPYRRFLGKCRLVVDYSQVNEEHIIKDRELMVYRFRYGYIPLSAFRLPAGSGEPVFFGFLTKRRKEILDRLKANGVKVNVYNNHWGTQRDLLVRAAGVVLNLSKHDNSVLEVYRLWLSLCLGVPVISEKGIDDVLATDWADFVCFIDDADELRDWRSVDLPDASLYCSGSCFRTEAERLIDWIAKCLGAPRLSG